MGIDVNQPIFVISVAAELADMHPQTLRQYDRLGIVSPSRAPGSPAVTPRMMSTSCGRSSASRSPASHSRASSGYSTSKTKWRRCSTG